MMPVSRLAPNLWRPSVGLVDPHWRQMWQGLVWAAMPGGAWTGDVLEQKQGTLFGTAATHSMTPWGHALVTDDITNDGIYYPWTDRLKSIVNQFTVAVFCSINSSTEYKNSLCIPWLDSATWSQPYVYLALTTFSAALKGAGRLIYKVVGESNFKQAVTVSTSYFLDDNAFHLYTVSRLGGLPFRFFRDGVLFEAVNSNHAGDMDWGSDNTSINLFNRNYQTVGEGAAGKMMMAAIWNRYLTDDEHRRLAEDPFGMFRPAQHWQRPGLAAADINLDSGADNPANWLQGVKISY